MVMENRKTITRVRMNCGFRNISDLPKSTKNFNDFNSKVLRFSDLMVSYGPATPTAYAKTGES
jgi:hypothetical protein